MCTCGRVVLVFGFIGLCLMIAGIVIGYSAVLDGYINDQIAESVRLEQGTEQFERWENVPFPLQFKVYVFNVSNPEEIVEGATPIVEEIGPFVYNQTRNKEDIVYDEGNDTLTYKQRLWFEFNEEESAFPETTELTVLNVALQGVFLTFEKRELTSTLNLNWNKLFHGDGMFITITAREFFFDGYQFCINSELQGPLNSIARTICSTIKREMEESKTITSDADKVQFSFFSYKHDNTDGEYTISAGNEDVNTLGAILSWESLEYIDAWTEDNNNMCNRIRGRDSTLYPPYNNDSSSFDIYNTDICRIVNLKYSGTTTYQDIDGIVLKLHVDDMTNDGDQSCYCTSESKNLNDEYDCLPDGFADMYTCLKAPVLASFPHMLDADETYRDSVIGMEPDILKHRTFVAIEPDTGSPLQGAKRMQFNMLIKPIQNVVYTQNITPAIFPILWVEEGFNLPDDLVQQMKDDYFTKLRLLTIVTWVLISLGIALIGVCLGYFAIRLCV